MTDKNKRLENLKRLRDSFSFISEDEEKVKNVSKPLYDVQTRYEQKKNEGSFNSGESKSKSTKNMNERSEVHQLSFELFQMKCDILTLLNLFLDEKVVKIKDRAAVEKMFMKFRTEDFHIINNMEKPIIYGE